tara:strand:+ start:1607 stop:3946 length:2340 start_codon:yes stop_codon:yes gene_type:complete
MATPAQIDAQVELERDQIRQGLKRLRASTRNLEEKTYASASVYGVTTIDALLPLVVEKIKKTNTRIHEGHTGRSFKEIAKYLADLEPLAAAAITCKITIDRVFGFKEGCNQLVNVCDSIGKAVEAECQMRHYETHAPGLLDTLKKNYWHRSIGTEQKVRVISTLMNRYEVKKWEAWGRANRVRLGSWLLDCVLDASHWFAKDMKQEGRKRMNYVVPTPEFLKIKDQVMYNAELFSPIAWPMLIEPNDWSNEKPGGYLLNEIMRGHDMVRRSESSCIQGETPIAFLNKIQKVAYTLNPFIVDVAEQLQEKQISVGKFLPIVNHDLPPKPVDIADNYESRKDYRRRTAEVMNKNAQEFKRSCRTRMTMEAVERFKDKEKFYIPWSFDYRGRIYPVPAFLTPQDTDFGKSLLRFADESFVDDEAERWLRFQVATTYGLDKETMSDRLHWTYKNEWLITQIAEDPLGYLSEWEVAEEPWQFLAACDEFYHCIIKRDRLSTGQPIAIDATCSGVQIIAGLTKCKSTAEMVNVIPSSKPQDVYKVVAETSKSNIPERLRSNWDRKCTKRTVMTIPYNAKPFSNRSYIRDALREKHIEIDKEELTQTVRAVRDAMNVVVPGAMRVMKWIEDEVSKAIKRGVTELKWVTPSGFVVTQKLMKTQWERVTLQVLGQCNMRVATGDTDEVDKNRHKAATAPNLIHSLDATLLCLSALRFDAPIALIHDSVLCRSTDMSNLSTLVRETYMHLFAEHDYLTDFAKQIGAESEPPIIGDLKPSEVIESTYFFC